MRIAIIVLILTCIVVTQARGRGRGRQGDKPMIKYDAERGRPNKNIKRPGETDGERKDSGMMSGKDRFGFLKFKGRRRHESKQSDSSSSHEGGRPYHPGGHGFFRPRGPFGQHRPHHPRHSWSKHHSSENENSGSGSVESESNGSGDMIDRPDFESEKPVDGGNPEKPIVDGSGDAAEKGALP